jgi:hypothetical protein
MGQYSTSLADAFANSANAPGGDARLLPKLAGYQVLVVSRDTAGDAGTINPYIDAEAAAARGRLRMKPVGANSPKGWVIMPADNYYASAAGGPSQVPKEESVARYLDGIEKAAREQQITLAYSAPVDTRNPGDPNTTEPQEAHPNAPVIKTQSWKKDRFFIRNAFEAHQSADTHLPMVKVAIPRVFWGHGNQPDFAMGHRLQASLITWVNNDSWNVVPLGQVDENNVQSIRDFKTFVSALIDPHRKINGIALWDYEDAKETQRTEFMQ